ncbi:hypothetical protein [uncultured Hoeflea sp.]|uniref:hypothetical protein n=1 Tax=uncultured Hoeflea sp. TaxID=538666 RepID=UPI0026169C10|nr:hypothetical protein [uncultured Hoeflea sp.]
MKKLAATVLCLGYACSLAQGQSIDRTMNFPFIQTQKSGPKSVSHTQQICLPTTTDTCDEVVVDFSRTSNSGPAPYGDGGPGYGISISRWNNPKGVNAVSHSVGGNCLTSTVKVTRKRRQRGWYSGNHTIYGKCVKPKNMVNESGLSDGEVFQHSAKVVCGRVSPDISDVPNSGVIAVPGLYAATVNVHNPSYENIRFRWKLVPAGRAQDAGHSRFTHGEIAADNAQYFDCTKYSLKPTEFFDGFFVIESEAPLDVKTFYSATDEIPNGQVAIHVDTVQEKISSPGEDWFCHNKKGLDIADPAQWFLSDDTNAKVIPGTGGVMSYKVDGGDDGSLKPGDYVFERDICVCGTDGKESGFAVNWQEVRSDDGIELYMVYNNFPTLFGGSPVVTTNPPLPQPAFGPANMSEHRAGTHTIQAVVKNIEFGGSNAGNTMKFAPKGILTLNHAYLGSCMRDE